MSARGEDRRAAPHVSSADAFAALAVVGGADRPLRLGEIAAGLGLAPSTARRAVTTLALAGYLDRPEGAPGYVLGETAHQLRRAFFAGFPVRVLCLPYLQQLAFMSGETTTLTVALGRYAVRIAAVSGTNEVIAARPPGGVRALARDPAGRAILAFQPPERRARLVHASGAGPTGEEMESALAAIRARGYAAAREPDGPVTITMPLRAAGRAVAAMAVECVSIDPGRESGAAGVERWLAVAGRAEAVLADRSETVLEPYGHLDPDAVSLAETE